MTTAIFVNKLNERFSATNNLLCVGLDVTDDYLTANFAEVSLFELNKRIVDATAELALCYKPQFAYYAAVGKEQELEQIITYIQTNYPQIPVILDAKRGDIGTTAQKYAEEAFIRYKADAVTVNPYMGYDAVSPFLAYQDKGTIVLARTSNASGAFLLTEIDGKPLYLHWSEQIVTAATDDEQVDANNIQFVVGATDLTAIASMRDNFPNNWLLVPGVGAQGGRADEVVRVAKREGNPCPMTMINVSRGILPKSTIVENKQVPLDIANFNSQVTQLAKAFADDIKNELNK